jgi:hypothetical protein
VQLDRAKSRADAANTIFVVSGALAVATVVEIFFADWHDDRSAMQIQPVAALSGATGSFALAGIFW